MEIKDNKQYCLRWDRHATNMASEAECFFQDEAFLDCTLCAEGQFIQAHKLILSAASPYLANLLRFTHDKHPIIIFNDIRFDDLKALLAFIYSGTVNVEENHIESFLNAAQALLVRGLSEGINERQRMPFNPPKPAETPTFSKFDESLTKLQDISFVKKNQCISERPPENYIVKSWKVNSVEDINGKINKANKSSKNFMYKKFKLEKPMQLEVERPLEKENADSPVSPILVEPKIEVMMEEDDTNCSDPHEDVFSSTPVPKLNPTPPPPVPLMMCSASLREPEIDAWQKSFPNEPDQELPCFTCRKKYKSRYALNRHVLYECGKARKSFACDECGKKVTRQDTLQKHKLIHLVQHMKEKEDIAANQ